MLSFVPLASSSAGNSFKISDGSTSVLMDAGLRFGDLQKALEFRLSSIDGVLLSHSHGDHSKSIKELAKRGVNIYGLQATFDAIGLTGHRAISIEPKQQFRIGSLIILPLDTQHDVPSLGFVIATEQRDKLFVATDTFYVRYKIDGLTHIAIECNYSIDTLDENIANGRVPQMMRGRLLKSHFSLEHVKDFLRANDLSKLQEVHLLHLSDSNGDEERFKREIQEIVGKPVMVAKR